MLIQEELRISRSPEGIKKEKKKERRREIGTGKGIGGIKKGREKEIGNEIEREKNGRENEKKLIK